jgi:acyl-CoA thioesterase FadM
MGHINVQFYTTKLSEGMAHLAAALGLTEHQGLTLRYQRAFSRYLGELHAGDILDIRAAVLAVDAGRINLLAEIVNGATGRLSATFELYCEGYDPATQQAVPWPDALHQKMTALITKRTDQPRPPTVLAIFAIAWVSRATRPRLTIGVWRR